MSVDKYQLLTLEDDALLRLCQCEACRGTGPGGQKRNKTSTAVRISHAASGIAVSDDTTRSQHLNQHYALRKLRLELAVLALEHPVSIPSDFVLEPMPKEGTPQRAQWVAVVYDVMHECNFSLAPAAERFGCSASRLAKLLFRDTFLWQRIAQQRQKLGLSALNH